MLQKKGFTLVELIVVIAIVSITAAIAIPVYRNTTMRAAMATDRYNLRILNEVTVRYAWANNVPLFSVFEDIDDDDERMMALVDAGFLADAVEAKTADTRFFWDQTHHRWLHTLWAVAGPANATYVFNTLPDTWKSKFEFNSWGGNSVAGTFWEPTDRGLFNTGQRNADLMFIPNNRPAYTLTTHFQMEPSDSNLGGFGLFFETAINPSDANRDTGYILQFDRGFSEVIIRQREGGTESNDNILVRIGNRSTSTVKNESIPWREEDWWEGEHELQLHVADAQVGKKTVTIVLNGETILQDFMIDSDIDPANNFTGFRAWNNGALTVYDLDIK